MTSLCCEQLTFTQLADKFGTPLYVYSQAALSEAFQNYQTAFAKLNPLIGFNCVANERVKLGKRSLVVLERFA